MPSRSPVCGRGLAAERRPGFPDKWEGANLHSFPFVHRLPYSVSLLPLLIRAALSLCSGGTVNLIPRTVVFTKESSLKKTGHRAISDWGVLELNLLVAGSPSSSAFLFQTKSTFGLNCAVKFRNSSARLRSVGSPKAAWQTRLMLGSAWRRRSWGGVWPAGGLEGDRVEFSDLKSRMDRIDVEANSFGARMRPAMCRSRWWSIPRTTASSGLAAT